MNYRPAPFYVGDTWYLPVDDQEVHLFHLQFSSEYSDFNMPVGHAVSRDLIHWTTRPHLLNPADAAELDMEHKNCWTGRAVRTISIIFFIQREPLFDGKSSNRLIIS